MSFAGLSSISPTASANPSDFLAVRRQDTGQLFSALESGNLAGAQAAFQQLSSLTTSSNGNPFTGPKLSSDFTAIGQALQNGDLTGAQEAALKFGQDLVAANQKIHGANNNQTQTPSVVVNLSGIDTNPATAPVAAAPSTDSTISSTAGTAPSGSTSGTSISPTSGSTSGTSEIVINLGGANGSPIIDLNVGGSQIEISLAGANANGNSPSAIDLNFGGAANGSQIEISLANGSSGNPSETLGINVVA